ncbi:MAG: lysine-sensitive aspartokinase 3 [Nanoarchaeota archaeon]|nr:lysine-sensitive aspartokinase 3 [Nanoarchaeota archaeon]
MIVMKFGGTSVGNAEKIKAVSQIIKLNLDQKPVVVCSAVKGVTDMLIEMANTAFKGESTKDLLRHLKEKHDKIIRELDIAKDTATPLLEDIDRLMERVENVRLESTETLDHIQSYGERMSCRIVAAYLSKVGIKAKAHDAFDMGMITNPDFGRAEPLEHAPEMIKEHMAKMDHVPVVTGFIGKTTAGEITTLSRGGSDYTASIIGAATDSDEIQIWTDVDGIMSTDPKIVKDAKTIAKLSFDEASELAIFGAKVLHPKSIIPAMEKNIPVRVLNTYNPEGKGTIVTPKAEKTDKVMKAIACKKGISLVNVTSTRMLNAHGYLARVFDIFRDYQKSVDMISTSEVSISMTINDSNGMDKIVKDLEGIAKVKTEDNKAIICVVGEGLKHTKGLAGKVFSTVGKAGVSIEMISQGASEINISFVVDEEDADKTINALHQEFI